MSSSHQVDLDIHVKNPIITSKIRISSDDSCCVRFVSPRAIILMYHMSKCAHGFGPNPNGCKTPTLGSKPTIDCCGTLSSNPRTLGLGVHLPSYSKINTKYIDKEALDGLYSPKKIMLQQIPKYHRRSRNGYMFNLFGAINWMRKRQFVVTLSTTKVEYVVVTYASKEAI